MLQRLADAGLVKRKTVGIDATTLKGNAALRSIVRRDTGESYQGFLTKLAQASGIETPTRADLARVDRKRKKKGLERRLDTAARSRHDDHQDERRPNAPDHKGKHTVELETGAIVGVTVHDAEDGDTMTCVEALIEAAEQVETVRPDGEGCHSNQSLIDFEAVGIRSYISKPDRGGRNRKKNPTACEAVYRTRRQLHGPRGLSLLRLRGERLERSFAHFYETDGVARPYRRQRGEPRLSQRDQCARAPRAGSRRECVARFIP